MAKMINAKELAEVFKKLLTSDEIDDSDTFSQFMTEAAMLATQYCGGEVGNPAEFGGAGTADDPDEWTIGILANDNLPDDGGIWKDYDTDTTFLNGEEVQS
jgi:hypothetical protein